MTNKSNQFTRSALALGIAAVLAPVGVSYAQEQDDEEGIVEEVVVVGIRSSIKRSQDLKRNAASITDSITATDIGKLPDATIADSLQRITGVQIQRSAGEGSGVNIRGNGQVMTTLNGEQMLSAGSLTRTSPDFADIPSTMVSGLDVVKSPTAKEMVGGITGNINLRTNRPFTLEEGMTLLGKVEAIDGSLGEEKLDKSASIFGGYNVDGKIGFSLGLSYSDIRLADYQTGNTGEDWSSITTEASNFAAPNSDQNRDDVSWQQVPDTSAGAVEGDTVWAVVSEPNDVYYAPQGLLVSNRFIERSRVGVNGSFQYMINDALELTVDAFYTDMEEYQYGAEFTASNSWKDFGWFELNEGGAVAHERLTIESAETNDVTFVNPDSSFLIVRDAIWQSRRNMVHSDAKAIEKKALNTSIQIKYDNGGAFTGSARLIHGVGKNDEVRGQVDAYINDASQASSRRRDVRRVGNIWGEPGTGPVVDYNMGFANPWGVKGVPAISRNPVGIVDADGNPAPDHNYPNAIRWDAVEGNFVHVPIGISYNSDDDLVWRLPLISAAYSSPTFYREVSEWDVDPEHNSEPQPQAYEWKYALDGDQDKDLFVYVPDEEGGDGEFIPVATSDDVALLGNDIRNYAMTSTNYTGFYEYADLTAFRVDGSYTFDFDFLDTASIDFGVRYGTRTVEREEWVGAGMYTNALGDQFVARWKDAGTEAPGTKESYIPAIGFSPRQELNADNTYVNPEGQNAVLNADGTLSDATYQNPAIFNDPSKMEGKVVWIDDFQGTQGLPGAWFVDPEAMKDPEAFHKEVYGPDQVRILNPNKTYTFGEDVISGYFQANAAVGIFSGNVGVRVVQTEYDIKQAVSGGDDQTITLGGNVFTTGPGVDNVIGGFQNIVQEFTEILPTLNLSFDVTENQKIRFAASRNMSNQDAQKLAGGLSVDRTLACGITDSAGNTVFCATGATRTGNPELKPFISKNMELSWEWYFSDTGMFNLGYFQYQFETTNKRIQVEDTTITDSDGVVRGFNLVGDDFRTEDGVPYVPTKIDVSVDDDAIIRGYEIGYQQSMEDFVEDGFWSGFGWSANYTYSPSTTKNRDYYGEYLPVADNSKIQYNVALWYDKGPFEARIALNRRSDRYVSLVTKQDVSENGDSFKIDMARMAAPATYVDASVSYDIGDFVTVSLQGTNLTEESTMEYIQWTDNVDKQHFNERRLTLSLQAKL